MSGLVAHTRVKANSMVKKTVKMALRTSRNFAYISIASKKSDLIKRRLGGHHWSRGGARGLAEVGELRTPGKSKDALTIHAFFNSICFV